MNTLIRHSAYRLNYLVLSVVLIVSWLSTPVVASGLVSTGTNGSVGYTYRSTSYNSDAYDNQHLLKANVDNTFFIWRDWFITGSANLVFTQEQTNTESSTSSSFSSTGHVGFSILPQSSTPFGFSYTRSDSRVDSDVKFFTGKNAASLDDNIVNDSLILHQSLIGKGYRLKVKYSDEQFNSTLRGKYGSNSIGLTGLLRAKTGVLRASAVQKDEVTYDGLDRDSRIARVNHNYTGFKQTTINTALSSSQIQQTTPSAAVSSLSRYSVTLNQASTSLIWRSLDKKMTITSGLRFSEINSVVSNKEGAENRSLSANLGATYRLTSNLSVNANMTRAINEFIDGESTLAQERIGVKYRSDEIRFDELSYDWRFGADLGRREDDGKESNDSAISLGHGLARNWGFEKNQQVYVRGSQDYSLNSLADRTRQRLSHRVSLGWKQVQAGMNRRIQMQLSDQRDLNDESALQTVSIDVNQQTILTRRIRLNGSLNYQLTNYQYADRVDGVSLSETSVVSANGNLSYMNPFSIAGLVFTSDYRYSQSVVTAQDDLTVQQTWNNKFSYRVGKIDVSLQYLYREARKISYNGIYFNVKRVF